MDTSIQVHSNAKDLASFTDIPYQAGKTTVTPFMAATVNHATNNETAKITDTIYLAHDTVMEREERLRRQQYRARRNRETVEER